MADPAGSEAGSGGPGRYGTGPGYRGGAARPGARGVGRAAAGTGRQRIEDDVARELLAVRALIESSVAEHTDRQARHAWFATVDSDEREILAAVRKVIAETTTDLDVVLASDAAHVGALHAALDEWLAGDGGRVRTRMLCAQTSLDWDFVHRQVREGRPLEVRTARIPLLVAFVADSRTALVCADSPTGPRASAIRDPGVIVTLQTLFDGIWRTAMVVNERIDFGDRARTEMVRPILEWLRLGVTDEVAARQLSVSVRTYRRYVAEIMALLGANSRFQAGVRAAELGLLPVVAPRDPPPPRR